MYWNTCRYRILLGMTECGFESSESLAGLPRLTTDLTIGPGVSVGGVTREEEVDLAAELDAAVAHLYGLKEGDVRHIFETFHAGWDPTERLERVLEHYRSLG